MKRCKIAVAMLVIFTLFALPLMSWAKDVGINPPKNPSDKTGKKGNENNNSNNVNNKVNAGAMLLFAPNSGGNLNLGTILAGEGYGAPVPVDNENGYGSKRFDNVPSAAFVGYMGCVTSDDYGFFLTDWARWNNKPLGETFRLQPVITRGSWISRWEPSDRVYFLDPQRVDLSQLNGISSLDFGFFPVIKGEDVPENVPRQAAYMYAAGVAAGIDPKYRGWYRANVLIPVWDTFDLKFGTKGWNVGGGATGASGYTGFNTSPIAAGGSGIAGYAQAENELKGRAGVLFLAVRTSDLLGLLKKGPPPKEEIPEVVPPEDDCAKIKERIRETEDELRKCKVFSMQNLELRVKQGKNWLEYYSKCAKTQEEKTEALRKADYNFMMAEKNYEAIKNDKVDQAKAKALYDEAPYYRAGVIDKLQGRDAMMSYMNKHKLERAPEFN